MQSIFRPAARRERLGEHPKGDRRDGGLKMLCIMLPARFFPRMGFLGKSGQDPRGPFRRTVRTIVGTPPSKAIPTCRNFRSSEGGPELYCRPELENEVPIYLHRKDAPFHA